jgi:putative transposase
MDVTLFKTVNGVKHYLYLIRDNYSRAILACKAATSYSSEIARDTLYKVLNQFGLLKKEGTLITDGGSENKGALTEWLGKTGSLWKKIVAQVDIVQSNSMAEAANKILKYRYLFPNPITDTGELVQVLDKALADYKQVPQNNLYGFTPDEVLKGAIPDKHQFKTQIAAAKKKRISINQAISCSDDCSP